MNIIFTETLACWYAKHARQLPWRDTSDPYRIWISEVILQQTRVAQGYTYYLRFVDRFPNVESLAEADEDEVLKYWQGLGYYSRARNLHAASKQIVSRGGFPSSFAELRKLKGVGDYTAAAIASFAFGEPVAVVDGNVYRVLSRYFALDTPIDSVVGKKEFSALAQELLDKRHPAVHNQAIMDFGALQCTPRVSPLQCAECPLSDGCLAWAARRVSDFPVKKQKVAVQSRFFTYIYIRSSGQLLLRKRGNTDIWKGLYEPFVLETTAPLSLQDVLQHHRLQPLLTQPPQQFLQLSQSVKHQLTHRTIWADFYLLHPADELSMQAFARDEGYLLVDEIRRDAYAVPRLVSRLWNEADSVPTNAEKQK